MKKTGILSVILVFIILFTSCQANETELEKGGTYLFVTGKNGGTYNSLGTAMASVVDKYLQSTTTIISTTGSVDNIDILTKGDAEFAFCQSDIFWYAINGKEMFKDNPKRGLAVLGKLYSESVQIVVNSESEIETIDGLKGLSVAVGPYGSATEAAARAILTAYGISYDDITVKYQSFADASNGLSLGTVDAIFAVSAMPSGNIAGYADTHSIRFLPISTQVCSKLKRSYPFFSDGVILSETYGTSNSVSTLNIDILLICRSDLSDSSVYSVTKALFDNLDELSANHSYGNNIFKETAPELKFGDYHSGAQKYYSVMDTEEPIETEPEPEPQSQEQTEEPNTYDYPIDNESMTDTTDMA